MVDWKGTYKDKDSFLLNNNLLNNIYTYDAACIHLYEYVH